MRSLFDAYLSGDASAFFNGHFTSPADRRRAVDRAVRPVASAVADTLEAQNARLAPSRARTDHLAHLRRGAAAVVTGQQVGLFLGPLYTIYKAASAVSAARALAVETGKPVVPIFWLQTEDHDLVEIANSNVPCAAGPPLEINLPASPDQRISIASCRLPDEVAGCLDQLRRELAHLPNSTPHLARLARHYVPAAGWSAAFAGLLGELFAEEGLVLFDPRDAGVGPATMPMHRRSLEQALPIAEALERRVDDLAQAGFAAPVHIRHAAPLSFFHPQGPAGARYRLDPTPDGFVEVGGHGSHTLPELLALLEAEPLRFSTSALLRPILQDTLLPTAAYVGGPGEIAYFAQLGPLYEAHHLPMPLVVPRARLRVIEAKTTRLLQRLHLSPDDAARPEDELLAQADAGTTSALDGKSLIRMLLEPFEGALRKVGEQIADTGPGLRGAIEKTNHSVEHAVTKLIDKFEKARLHQNVSRVADVRRAKEVLYPHGTPQERVYGLAYFAARYGERPFIEQVLKAIVPFDAMPRDLHWGEDGS